MNEAETGNQTFAFAIEHSPLHCSLQELLPIDVELVSATEKEKLWDYLVKNYHYLSHRTMVGCNLKYLAFHRQRPIAALGWRAAALKVEVRDCFIGWSAQQRKEHLKQIVNNNRFLILPWVQVHNLGSYLLSKTLKRLPQDWYEAYGERLLLVETFVDGRYRGTCYQAANWIHVGRTKGYTKLGPGFVWHGQRKEVWLYVVEPAFRKILGCRQRAVGRWSPKLTQREGTLQMILRHTRWDPEVVPCMELTPKDMEKVAEELLAFHQEFIPYYGRREHHRLGLAYLRGLMSDIQRKTAEGIALLLLGPDSVRYLQNFITNYVWDHQGMQGQYQRSLSQLIGATGDEGMLNVDSSEFAKKGNESVGVARQFCGNLGKVENCQSGVFVGYASGRGYGLVDCQLFMPEKWFTDAYEERRRKCQVPEELVFQTKIQIARDLIRRVTDSGLFRATWLGCDCTFGSAWAFLDEVGRDYWYFASVRSDTLVWLSRPKLRIPRYRGKGRRPRRHKVVSGKPITVAEVAAEVDLRWRSALIAEGAKGPIVAEVARVRVIECREGLPGKERWLCIRRYAEGELKYALSNASKKISFRKLLKASTLRWPIEQCFEEGKEHLGMDHYEHRSWPGWQRHMLFVFLAQLFLMRLRHKFKKNSCPYPCPGPAAGGNDLAGR